MRDIDAEWFKQKRKSVWWSHWSSEEVVDEDDVVDKLNEIEKEFAEKDTEIAELHREIQYLMEYFIHIPRS